MTQSISDMYNEYLAGNPTESAELKAIVRDALARVTRETPGAPVTGKMLDSLVQSVVDELGADEGDGEFETVSEDYFDQPADEVFAPRRRPPIRPHRRPTIRPHRRSWRFPPHFGPRGNDLIRFLILSELLGR